MRCCYCLNFMSKKYSIFGWCGVEQDNVISDSKSCVFFIGNEDLLKRVGGNVMQIPDKSRLTPNFRFEELASRGELPEVVESVYEFARMAQELRDWAADTYAWHKDDGLILSNWYRSRKHNDSVGGSKNSAHLDARAMDIVNVRPETFREFVAVWRSICLRYNRIGGINLYSTYIHITDYEDKFGHKTFIVRK